MNRTSETPANFGCPREVEKSELFYQETHHSQNFRNENLEISPFEKPECAPISSFHVKVTCESHKRLKVHLFIFTHQRMNEYE